MGNIVAVTPDRDHYISSIEPFLESPLIFLRTTDWDQLIQLDPKAVIFLGDWLYEQGELVKKCRERRIPTILMMDGTIEWKHFFENPKWSYGGNEAPYLPVQCDKVFVPGAGTYRFLDFFGNQGKCEITGLPRFDIYAEAFRTDHTENDRKKTLGVMSGNTAGYTEEQISESKQLFEDLSRWAESQTEVEVKWRLRKGFEKVLDVKIISDEAVSLIEFLGKVDAVISQPSTAAYEAMLAGLPVGLADYSTAPNYMHAAWEIHSREHISRIISEMMTPSSLKTSLQQHLLDDNIAYCGDSSELTGRVINEIVRLASEMPENIWEFPPMIFFKVAEQIPGKTDAISYPLFERRTAYKFTSFTELQEEYIKLKRKNEKILSALKRRTLGFWLERLISKFTR